LEYSNDAETKEIAEQILNSTMQEIIRKGYGHKKKKDYGIYCGCNIKNRTVGHRSVKKEIEKYVLEFEPYNNSICKLRLKGKYHNLSLICILGATEDSDTDIKEQFYEDLQIMHDRPPKQDVK
jgi:hypothetical protein